MIFILLVTSTWHWPWNGWQVFLSLLSSKILFKEDTLFTHTKSDDPPAPDCLLQMTIFHLHIRWLLLHSATNHILYIKQRPPNSFNIFSGAVDQIRSKKRNTKHALQWSRFLLNIRCLKPKSEFLLISRKMKLFVYETYTIEKETFK